MSVVWLVMGNRGELELIGAGEGGVATTDVDEVGGDVLPAGTLDGLGFES